jgi:pyridoxine kinase
MKAAAVKIHALGPKYVLIKGGAKVGMSSAIDILYDGKVFEIVESPLVNTTYTHGAGCIYASAVAAGIAKGFPVPEAVREAKNFIYAAIKHSFPLNQYVGPTCHAAHRFNK